MKHWRSRLLARSLMIEEHVKTGRQQLFLDEIERQHIERVLGAAGRKA